ncbi:MAG: hypothetical protein OXU20_27495, partial [Myxococcales bacterium]|nr:hypothetical protein [Myxococcales bacterium]
AGGVARRVDRALVAGAITPNRRARASDAAERLDHTGRMRGLALMGAFYGDPAWLAPDSGFFPKPAPISPHIRRIRRLGRTGEVLELCWPSAFQPLWCASEVRLRVSRADAPWEPPLTIPEREEVLTAIERTARRGHDFRTRYASLSNNRTAHARLYRHHDGPRPTVVLLHGFLGGFSSLDATMLQAKHFYLGGMDVVMTVLPLHGPRRESRGLKPPRFPGSDPRYTVEGFRQLVFDHQALFDYLLCGQVASLGIGGMSLGGYGAALLATLDPRLRFALLHIPLCSISEFALRTGRMVGTQREQREQARALGRVHRPISPSSRPPALPGTRVHIVTGRADEVTGPQQATTLVTHFNAQHHTFSGGHVVQFERTRALQPFFDMLRADGLWNPKSTPRPAATNSTTT